MGDPFCPRCGKAQQPEHTFCPFCGASLQAAQGGAESAPEPPSAARPVTAQPPKPAPILGEAEMARVREAEEQYWRALRRRSRRNALGCVVVLVALAALLWVFVLRPLTPASRPRPASPARVPGA